MLTTIGKLATDREVDTASRFKDSESQLEVALQELVLVARLVDKDTGDGARFFAYAGSNVGGSLSHWMDRLEDSPWQISDEMWASLRPEGMADSEFDNLRTSCFYRQAALSAGETVDPDAACPQAEKDLYWVFEAEIRRLVDVYKHWGTEIALIHGTRYDLAGIVSVFANVFEDWAVDTMRRLD